MTPTIIAILGVSVAVITAVAVAFAGFVFGKMRTDSSGNDPILQERLTRAEADKQELQAKNQYLAQNFESEKEMRIRLEAEVKIQEKTIADWEKYKQEVIQGSEAAILKSARELSTKLLAEHKTEAENVQKLGEKNFKQTSDNLQEHFNKLIGKVSEFEGRLGHQESGLDILNRMLTEPQKMGEVAEVILENNLKIMGLTEPQDFIMQPSFDTTAGKLRPDAVIFLPDDNVIIVDSKSSSIFKELAMAEADDTIDKATLYKKLKDSMRKHLKDLDSKEYQSVIEQGIKTQHRSFRPNGATTLLWVPTDGMLEHIHKADENFTIDASKKQILVVGPSALHASIAVAAIKISTRKQSENQTIIVQETTTLLQSITTALKHAGRVGRAIQTADKAFEDLAGSVNRNLLPKARRLVNLGVSKPQGDLDKPLPSRAEEVTTIEDVGDSTEPLDHPDE